MKVTVIFTVEKSELADIVKKQMIREGYPERDLENFEDMIDGQDIAQWLLHDITDNVVIEED